MVKIRDLENGADLCLRNAERLIEDAELLSEHESYGHATSLVYLGLEELGKALEFSRAYFFGEELEDKNDVFRYHKKKMRLSTGAILGPAIVEVFRTHAKERPLTKESIQKFARETDLISRLEKAIQEAHERRKAGFYVGYENGEWCSPSNIRREEAKSLVDFGKQGLAEIGFICKMLIKGAPLRDKLCSEALKRCKAALDKGEISQELYDAVSSELETLTKK